MNSSGECCPECRCPDTCDQPGEHCRFTVNGKPAHHCHQKATPKEWESVAQIIEATFPQGDMNYVDRENESSVVLDGYFNLKALQENIKAFIEDERKRTAVEVLYEAFDAVCSSKDTFAALAAINNIRDRLTRN